MNFFSYLKVELNRIFRSKIVYVIMLLTIVCPMIGYKIPSKILYYINARILGDTTSVKIIAQPCLIGALLGGIFFALLTLLEFDRVRKYETVALTNSIVSPLISNVVRVIGILITAIITVSITALLYLPYTMNKLGDLFDAYTYLNCFFLFMMCSILLSIIAASAFYQIFRRVDISMVLFIVFAVLSSNKKFDDNNIMHWTIPTIPTLSDYFSNDMVFNLMKHNRLFWFLALIGLWMVTLLCVRSYGKGLIGSFLHNLKKIYIPLIAMILIGGGCYAYINQPLYEHNDTEIQRSKQLKLSDTDLEITFDAKKDSLLGKASYSLQNLSNSPQQCTLILNPGYKIQSIVANDKKLQFKALKNDEKCVELTLPGDAEIKLNIEYSGSPKVIKKLSDFISATTISDKYIDLKGMDLCPNIVLDKENKNPQITGKFTMASNLMPISEGGTVKLISENGNNKTWSIDNKGGSFFSFYLVAGDYSIKKLGDKDMPVEFYYSNKAKSKMDTMNAEEIMNYTLNYCRNHYGKLYNVSNENPLKLVQGTAFQFGGLGLSNFSIMEESSFDDRKINNKLSGPSSLALLAHETVHQWFSYRYFQDDENSDWTAEGLTVYATYRIMKEKYGEEYAKKNFVEVWEEGLKDYHNNFYTRNPEYLKILPEKYNGEYEGLNRVVKTYEKMPLQILKATKLVGGEENMDKILAKLYGDVPTKQNISWKGFLDACGLREEDLKVD